MPSNFALSAGTVIGGTRFIGNLAPSLRTAAMWNEPVTSRPALPLANNCWAGSTAVPVAFGWKYGRSWTYCFNVARNQGSVTFAWPDSILVNMSSVGALFITIEFRR